MTNEQGIESTSMKAIKPLDRTSPTPLYHQLLEVLKQQLDAGVWKPGEIFPREQELCDTYEVSRTTARAALHELVRSGLLLRERGRGTFVARGRSRERFVQSLGGFHREMASRGRTVTSDVRAQEVTPAGDDVAHALKIPLGTSVLHVARVRYVDGDPVVFTRTFLPFALCPDVLGVDLRAQSLYAYLERQYGFHPGRATRTVRAQPLPADVAPLLGAEQGACSLFVQSLVRLDEGTPLLFDISWYRGDRTTFEVEVMTEEVR